MKLTDRERWLVCRAAVAHGVSPGIAKQVATILEDKGEFDGAPPAPTCPGWVRVEDRLPPLYEDVWVWHHNEIETAHLGTSSRWWHSLHGEFGGVTHWREIQGPDQPCRCADLEGKLRRLAGMISVRKGEVMEPRLVIEVLPRFAEDVAEILAEFKGEE